jgi:hypothetical protein
MNEHIKGSNPKLILAVQMLCIGIVLLVLGIIVILLSPQRLMTPLFQRWSIISNVAIALVGLGFAIGGFIRYKKVKKSS